MIRIRRRKPLEALKNESRRRQVSRGRWLYLTVLCVAMIWVLDAFFGSTFYLKSEGLVAATPHTVATEYTATVRTIAVARGDRVIKGQVLLTVSSQAVNERLADFALKLAENRARVAEIRGKAAVANELASAAKERAGVDREAKRSINKLYDRGLVAVNRRAQAVREAYRSLADERLLDADAQSMRAQLEELTTPLTRAEDAFDKLSKTYADGIIVAPVDGTITALHVSEGSVVEAGQPLLEIQSGARQVFAYLPTGTLYTVRKGEKVTVWCGIHDYDARVDAILPLAVALPAELQKRFSPVERSQIAIIDFADPDVAPPLFTKVAVRSRSWLATSIKRLFTKIARTGCAYR